MKILITTRHIEVQHEIRESIENKIKKALKNIKDDVIEVNIAITAEKSRQSVEIKVMTNHTTFRCLEETHDLQLSVDKAVDVLARQVRKNKDRFQKKRRKTRVEDFQTGELPDTAMKDFDLSDTDIVISKKFASKPMSVEEALMQLKLSKELFIVFSNSTTNEVNVIYNRNDGKVGLIEPEF